MESTRHFLIAIKDGESIKDWMIRETLSRLSNRYKAIHMAEDLGVFPSKIHRFLTKKNVNDDFYQRWFQWYIKKQ
jgi:hypothetical protein